MGSSANPGALLAEAGLRMRPERPSSFRSEVQLGARHPYRELSAGSTFSITIAREPPFVYTLPVTVTILPA